MTQPRYRIRLAGLALIALTLAPLTSASAATARSEEGPPVFKLVLAGVEIGTFTEVSGLGSESEILEHRAIGANGQEQTLKIPGRSSRTAITLKRGFTSSTDLWEWRALVEAGVNAQRDGSLVLVSPRGRQLGQWFLYDAWPASVQGSIETSADGAVATEEVVIVVQDLERVP